MRFASLGSGSEGNGLVVEAGATRDPDRLRVRRARHGDAPRAARLAPVVARRDSRHARARRSCRRRARVRRALRHSGLADVRHAGRGRRALRGHGPRLRLRQPRRVRDRRRSRSVPFPVPHDAREPVQFVVGDGAHRLGVLTDLGMSTPLRRGEPVRLRRAGARVQPRPRHARERRLSVSAEAADRRAPRPSAQRGGRGAAGARSTPRASCTSSPRTCRSRTTRRSSRAPRWRRAGLPAGLDRHRATRRLGFAWRETVTIGRRPMEKAAGALQGQGQDGVRDRRSALSRHALPRRRVGVRRRQAREARRRRARPTTRSTRT